MPAVTAQPDSPPCLPEALREEARRSPPPSRAALCDLGLMAFSAAHRLQLELAAQRHRGELNADLLLCVEHPPVFTLGRQGDRSHLGVSETFLDMHGIALHSVERGGEITYHGPGQLVVYPIVDLRRARLTVSGYVHLLEEAMLRLAADCGVTAGRDPRNHGVWAGNRKLGSVGIAIRHGIAFHGLALNVDMDLQPFAWINPCGLRGITMTSLVQEGSATATITRLKTRLPVHLAPLFGGEVHVLRREQMLAVCRSAHSLS